jgi:nucleotide-binding universal stress UspA family protein
MMIKIKTVLVATDFSEPSVSALEYGRALARTFQGTLHVLHVVQDVIIYGPADIAAGMVYSDIQREFQDTARRELDKAVRDDDRRELNAQSVLLTSSSPASAIAEYAKKSGADVIVIGTHGRTGFTHLFMGSVAEKVVRIAPCPVLTVRHPEHEFVLPDALQTATRAAK